jgi:hypothetical protein
MKSLLVRSRRYLLRRAKAHKPRSRPIAESAEKVVAPTRCIALLNRITCLNTASPVRLYDPRFRSVLVERRTTYGTAPALPDVPKYNIGTVVVGPAFHAAML